jgi:hypothetical protein
VVGAATGAGIIIGTYFAFYSTTKRFLRERTEMSEPAMAFTSGAVAALGSSVVKVPLAVCIRSVQAGIYQNVFHAARSIVSAAGVRGLFTVRRPASRSSNGRMGGGAAGWVGGWAACTGLPAGRLALQLSPCSFAHSLWPHFASTNAEFLPPPLLPRLPLSPASLPSPACRVSCPPCWRTFRTWL